MQVLKDRYSGPNDVIHDDVMELVDQLCSKWVGTKTFERKDGQGTHANISGETRHMT